jgi:xanthine dehydrogenase small subunit
VLAYLTPETTEEVLALRGQHGEDAVIMGGGTIVMNLMNEGLLFPDVVIGLARAGWNDIESDDNGDLVVGAMTTLAALASARQGLLSEAASACGGWAIRNMATIGGNVFAPAPAGDLGVALLALDARLRIGSVSGSRSLPIAEFFASDRSLAETEVVIGFEVPSSEATTRFIKFGRKHGPTPAVVTVAISLVMHDGVMSEPRIALGAMGPHPVRARQAESLLEGHGLDPDLIASAALTASEEHEGLTDEVATTWYRKRMARLHVSRLLSEMAANGSGDE